MGYKTFYAETVEEMEKIIADNIDEKYQKTLMDFIKQTKEKKNAPDYNPDVKTYNFVQNEESNQTDKRIVILKTTTATLIVPILMYSDGNIDISLEISKQGNNKQTIVNNIPLSVESDIKSHEGLLPLLVIPHNSEGNDNEGSITQIIDYLLMSFSKHISIQDLAYSEADLTGKFIIIK